MSSRAANWMIAAGAFGMFVGLCLLPAAMRPDSDSSVLALSACMFSLGALMTASGLYLKARKMQSAAPAPEVKGARRVRTGCELCGGDAPVIHCKVHQLHLCPACLAEHYNFRSCVYAPSTRRTMVKQKGTAKARSASLS
jgi:hypothetical protein